MPTIVISVPGALVTYNAGNFGGALFSAPNTYIDGEPTWQNGAFNFNDSSITDDMNHLDSLMQANIGNVPAGERLIVCGHSRGGQTIYKWIRQIGPTSPLDPAKILFISSGNPERKYGGASVYDWNGHKPVYPGTVPYGNGYGLPVNGTRYTLYDIARQYDEWADHPYDLTNTTAHDLTTDANVHSAYSACPPIGANGEPVNWDDWTYWTEGTITYLVAPFWPYPGAPAQPAYTTTAQIFPLGKRRQNEQYGYTDLQFRWLNERAFNRVKPIQPPRPYRWLGVGN